MRPTQRQFPHHFLKPGEMFFGIEPTVVSTLLGSCVSVVMFSPRFRIGAICHGLLPECKDNDSCQCLASCKNGFRYMSCSIRMMLDKFRVAGINPGELQVKLFGGADMFAITSTEKQKPSVGRQNIDIATKLLEKEGIPLLASDTGGGRGRKLFFYTHTGEVLLQRLNRQKNLSPPVQGC